MENSDLTGDGIRPINPLPIDVDSLREFMIQARRLEPRLVGMEMNPLASIDRVRMKYSSFIEARRSLPLSWPNEPSPILPEPPLRPTPHEISFSLPMSDEQSQRVHEAIAKVIARVSGIRTEDTIEPFLMDEILKANFFSYMDVRRRRPPQTSTNIAVLWTNEVFSRAFYEQGLEGAAAFVSLGNGRNLNAAQMARLAIMAETSQVFAFALGLWLKAYNLETGVSIASFDVAVIAQQYLSQTHNLYDYDREALMKAAQEIREAVAQREAFNLYLSRVRPQAQVGGDILRRWNDRVLANRWHEQGVRGAELYLEQFGRGIGSKKLYAMATLAEQRGYPGMAHGFWTAAYRLDAGKTAPPYIDTTRPAVGSTAFRETYPDTDAGNLRRFLARPLPGDFMHEPQAQTSTPTPEPTPPPGPPELEEGGYWDERFNNIDI